MDDEIHKLSLAVRKEAMALVSEDKDYIVALVRYAAIRAGYELPYPFLDIVAAHFVQDLLELSKTMNFEREDLTPLTIKAKVTKYWRCQMARPAKELEKLSLKLREDAFRELSNECFLLDQLVVSAAKERNIELSQAEIAVIAVHLSNDLDEIGACFDTFNFEREVDEDYAEGYEDDEEES